MVERAAWGGPSRNPGFSATPAAAGADAADRAAAGQPFCSLFPQPAAAHQHTPATLGTTIAAASAPLLMPPSLSSVAPLYNQSRGAGPTDAALKPGVRASSRVYLPSRATPRMESRSRSASSRVRPAMTMVMSITSTPPGGNGVSTVT